MKLSREPELRLLGELIVNDKGQLLASCPACHRLSLVQLKPHDAEGHHAMTCDGYGCCRVWSVSILLAEEYNPEEDRDAE